MLWRQNTRIHWVFQTPLTHVMLSCCWNQPTFSCLSCVYLPPSLSQPTVLSSCQSLTLARRLPLQLTASTSRNTRWQMSYWGSWGAILNVMLVIRPCHNQRVQQLILIPFPTQHSSFDTTCGPTYQPQPSIHTHRFVTCPGHVQHLESVQGVSHFSLPSLFPLPSPPLPPFIPAFGPTLLGPSCTPPLPDQNFLANLSNDSAQLLSFCNVHHHMHNIFRHALVKGEMLIL